MHSFGTAPCASRAGNERHSRVLNWRPHASQRPRLRCSALLTTATTEAHPVAASSQPTYTNANFPVDPEGRTYHLGTRRGEVANRVLSVGSASRATLLSRLLTPPSATRPGLFTHLSSRGFVTITGRFDGVPVSIVTTHMGMPNMDFVVRETRAVVEGQMAFIRLGTCGAMQPPARLGDLLVATEGSVAVRRDPDAWAPGARKQRYVVTRPVPPDPGLTALLVEEAERAAGPERVVRGLNASADSFYSSQGRLGDDFDDGNDGVLDQLLSDHPQLVSLEMETFHLFDLARCSRGSSVRAAGLCIALAERYSNRFMDHAGLEAAELLGGRAALRALARAQLASDASTAPETAHPGVQYVWAQ